MSEIALDRTVWSGFRLTRKHPAAFGLWVLIDLVLGLGPTALLMAILGPNFFDLVRSSAESNSKPDPGLVMGLIGRATSLNSISLLATWVLWAMLYAAIFRSVLRPEQNRFGYLRLGKDEFLLFIMIAMFYIGFVALLAMAIFLVVLITALVAAASQPAGLVVGFLLTLSAGGALIWLAARLSMVMPMSFDHGRIQIREAWVLTRGHAKELLLLAVLLVVLGVAIAAVLFAVLSAAVGAFVAAYADASNMATFLTQPTKDVIRELTPWGLLAAALSAIVSTFGLVIFTAPWVEAYRQITVDTEHVEEVF